MEQFFNNKTNRTNFKTFVIPITPQCDLETEDLSPSPDLLGPPRIRNSYKSWGKLQFQGVGSILIFLLTPSQSFLYT